MVYDDYPTEPIGDGNPYHRCQLCRRSDPEINGRLEGHYAWCEWRQLKEKDKLLEKALSIISNIKANGYVVSDSAADEIDRLFDDDQAWDVR